MLAALVYAFAIAKRLQRAGADGSLESYFNLTMGQDDRKKAEIEGWILGVL